MAIETSTAGVTLRTTGGEVTPFNDAVIFDVVAVPVNRADARPGGPDALKVATVRSEELHVTVEVRV